MAPQITYFTDAEIEREREALLGQAGMSFDELEARARSFLLDSREEAVYRDLQDLDYLQAKPA